MSKFLSFLLALVIFSSCNTSTETKEISSSPTIDGAKIGEHIKVLSSDEFGGRMTFTKYETKTIEYLKSQLEATGVEPGNGESYYQKVPMVEIEVINMSMLKFSGNGFSKEYEYKSEFVALTRRVTESIEISNSELVFAGFGVVALRCERKNSLSFGKRPRFWDRKSGFL